MHYLLLCRANLGQAFRFSLTTFVKKACIKFEYVISRSIQENLKARESVRHKYLLRVTLLHVTEVYVQIAKVMPANKEHLYQIFVKKEKKKQN